MADSNRIILPPALGCFTWLAKPRPPMRRKAGDGDGPGRSLYQVTLIWKKRDKDKLRELADAVKAAALDAFGPSPKGKIRMPIRDGDADRPGYAEFVDSYFAAATSERRPGLVNARRQQIHPDDVEDEAYSGCTYIASVVPYSYDFQGNRGISLGLRNLMVTAKGPHLDGGVSAEEEFKDLGGGPAGDSGGVDDLL